MYGSSYMFRHYIAIFIVKAPATVISITVPCIIVCRGPKSSKESVSAVCWFCVKIWIRTGFTKTVVYHVNGIKKGVEYI
jgi:hypothetical protein